ncbi:MAG: hypothetical protein ABI435_04950 [Pseudolysinimonas sp.]
MAPSTTCAFAPVRGLLDIAMSCNRPREGKISLIFFDDFAIVGYDQEAPDVRTSAAL